MTLLQTPPASSSKESVGMLGWFNEVYKKLIDVDSRLVVVESIETFSAGMVQVYAGTTEPSGWLFCYGQSVDTTTYATLFAAIGYTYGGAGASFNLPDLRGRAVFGQDDMGGSSANRIVNSFNGDTLGQTGGAEESSLSSSNNGAHTHTTNVFKGDGGANADSTVNATIAGTEYTSDSSGSGTAFTNMPPSIILNYIIKT